MIYFHVGIPTIQHMPLAYKYGEWTYNSNFVRYLDRYVGTQVTTNVKYAKIFIAGPIYW